MKKTKKRQKVKNYNVSGKKVHFMGRLCFLCIAEACVFFFSPVVGGLMGLWDKEFFSPISVLGGAGVFIWWLVEYANALDRQAKKFMPGKEMGSGRWGEVEEFNERYENKEVPQENMILTKHVRKMYDKKTGLNNNAAVVGGSGAGKTAGFIGPNLLQMFGCNIYTDPKGSTLKVFAPALEAKGIPVKVLNLCEFDQSMQFNPFSYIKKETDVYKVIDNIIANTTAKGANEPEPFWKEGEKLCEAALFFYIWLECPEPYYKYTQQPMGEDSVELETEKGTIYRNPVRDAEGKQRRLDQTMRSFMLLLGEAEVKEDDYEMSALDCRFFALKERLKGEGRQPEEHKAIYNYFQVMGGAKDTVRSIVLSVDGRFRVFNTEEVLRIFDDDDMKLETIGLEQQALFLIIPDEDTTFNAVIGMLYTQLFQTMYRVARLHNDFLPVPVGVWMDEFANIKMPEDFEKILATIRSRNGYIVIILQSLSQLKVLYPNDAHEGILGNCDTFIYLGGNERSSHKYVSEMLGKWTIDKRTDNQTLGKQGSVSVNNDILGRELMTDDEVGLLSNEECIVKVRGNYPIRDRKYFWFENPAYDYVKEFEPYESQVIIKKEGNRMITVKYESPYRIIGEEELSKVLRDGKVQEIHPIDLLMQDVIEEKLQEEDWEIFKEKGIALYRELDLEQMNQAIEEGQKKKAQQGLSNLLEVGSFDDAQMEVILKALEEGMTVKQIEEFAKQGKSAAQMKFMKQLAQETK